jgi:hypothetical protein
MLVAVPGLLIGLVASDSDLGVRAAYRNLTEVLQDPLVIEAEIVVVPRPMVADPTAGRRRSRGNADPGAQRRVVRRESAGDGGGGVQRSRSHHPRRRPMR